MISKIQKLENVISKASEAYYNGSSIISDDEFDTFIYELSLLDPQNKILTKIGAEPVNEWKKEKHLTSLGSLNKANSPDEISKWINDTLHNQKVILIEKLDGLSIGCQYKDGKLIKACLRGNGLEGEDIYQNVIKMQGIIEKIPEFTGTIRGEIVLTKTDHRKYFPDYANPRNAASGLCRRLDGQGCEHLTLMFYQVISNNIFTSEQEMLEFLKKNGCIVPNYKSCTTTDQVIDIWKDYQSSIRNSLNYEIDGIVVVCDNVKFQQTLNETNLRPKYKIAFKFANQFSKTTVTDIKWVCGNSGRVTPVCWFEPVNLLGSNIQKASAYNIAYITKLGLGVGAEVLVCKAGEIIPRVEKVIKPALKVATIPTNCPTCETKLIIEGEYLLCPNIDKCYSQIVGTIKNWINTLNVLEWGTSLLERLVQNGLVTDPSDLYHLSVDDLATIERMGQRSAQKCYDTLWATNQIDLATFIGALNIPLIGVTMVQLLVDGGIDTLAKLRQASVDDFLAIKGLGATKATSLHAGLLSKSKLIDKLLAAGVKLMKKSANNKSEPKSKKLEGMTICITGSTEVKRDDLIKIIKENGGEFKSSVSKDTSHLMLADPSKVSTKTKNASKLGIKIISEADFFEMIG